jgi:phage terminase Nu1 subunit (DNA packaging protein)
VTVTGLPVPEQEEYVDRKALARMMGVSVRTVDRLVAQGMPSETWGRNVRRFKPSVALAWARGHHRY